ncbi:spore germination protein [Paenibacillus albus]|uniref:spore germination protein n=1 Tax=Paenibacillus albus TaxID=2495582 RepID=UPI001D1311FA|nr:spore germination protein [Paenibacillus albus]
MAQADTTGSVVSTAISINFSTLQAAFQHCSDFTLRPLLISDSPSVLIAYIQELTDTVKLEAIITAAVQKHDIELFTKYEPLTSISEVVTKILNGYTAFFKEGSPQAFVANLGDYEQRSITEPSNESSIRGPRESFTESLSTNLSLIRRKIRNPKLKFETRQGGTLSHTEYIVAYLEDTVDPQLLNEIRRRLDTIHTERLLDSGEIEELIEDKPFSLFPQIQNTERPDTVAASLMEGRVAIIVDGSPNALLLPMTFWSGFQAAEDHYERFIYVTIVRLLRLLLTVASGLVPSIYVALTTFHPQMIPLNLMMSIAAAREGLPFPTVIETLLMELMFEGLREAGLRLPKAIGSAVSIVGALVIGQAAVEAGFISAPVVMIVAGTGIASFAFPSYSLALPFRILRFPLLIAGGFLGLYGVAIGVSVIVAHLVTLKSFGVPYLKPVAPIGPRMWKDTFVRMHKRFAQERK